MITVHKQSLRKVGSAINGIHDKNKIGQIFHYDLIKNRFDAWQHIKNQENGSYKKSADVRNLFGRVPEYLFMSFDKEFV